MMETNGGNPAAFGEALRELVAAHNSMLHEVQRRQLEELMREREENSITISKLEECNHEMRKAKAAIENRLDLERKRVAGRMLNNATTINSLEEANSRLTEKLKTAKAAIDKLQQIVKEQAFGTNARGSSVVLAEVDDIVDGHHNDTTTHSNSSNKMAADMAGAQEAGAAKRPRCDKTIAKADAREGQYLIAQKARAGVRVQASQPQQSQGTRVEPVPTDSIEDLLTQDHDATELDDTVTEMTCFSPSFAI